METLNTTLHCKTFINYHMENVRGNKYFLSFQFPIANIIEKQWGETLVAR